MPRADQRLVELGLVASRARAQAEIGAGRVTLAGQPVRKPNQTVAPDAALELSEPENPWVSRGGLKLAHAFDRFAMDPTGTVALDIGASTGGFTQVLLARGASRVYSVDVGHDQMHASLRDDPRVVVIERTNARGIGGETVPEPIDLIVADVSFISLKLALPPGLALAKPGARLVALVKPQFEAGPGAAGKGVVRDAAARSAAVEGIAQFLADAGWTVFGQTPSPIRGGDGNEETFLAARRA